MSTNETNEQQAVGLPGDERDVLVSRVVDGVATGEDWTTFRAIAAHDPSIWTELADTQHLHETVCANIHSAVDLADRIELPGGIIDDQPLRARLDLVSRWGGWAAAAAILLVWFFGNSITQSSDDSLGGNKAGVIPDFGSPNVFLNDAKPNQAFDQYLAAGQSNGQVVGEMPEHIVIETRPMSDGTIEVLYLRQIIERQIIDHAYREIHDESGNSFPVPVKLSPIGEKAF